MSHTVTFTFHAPENKETKSQDTSPYDEGAVHDSFHQLIQEQSWLAEQEMVEMQDLATRGKDNVAYVASPPRQTEAWESPDEIAEHPDFCSATLQILASMPSRTIGRSRGVILSQYYNRTARLRRRSSRAPLQEVSRSARPSIRQLDIELDSGHEEEDSKRCLLVKELRSLPANQRINMLQAMPLSLSEKRRLRQDSSGYSGTLRKPKTTAPLSQCSRFKYHIIIAAYPSAIPNREAFTGLEPFTGAGFFTHTLLYYGYYSNFTLNDPCTSISNASHCGQHRHVRMPYNMPLAYLFVTGVSFFVTCILLVYSMSRSFGESYRVGSTSGELAVKVFCAWDYKVIQKRSIRLQSENICTQLKECLADHWARSHPLNLFKRLQRLVILLMAWTLSLGAILGCVIGVYYFSEFIHHIHQEKLSTSSRAGKEALLLALPLLVSLINLLVPYMYNLLAAWEKQESPVLEVYVAICRNLILKMVILGLLCYHWLSRKVTSSKIQCWETFVGQELYRLVVMDFIFTLLDTFFGELMWRVILEKKLQSKRKPEFDIARNVLELIYGQTLTWLGVFFAPLLPAVQIIKLLLLFYIKKASLMRNCQSPSKPWRASHMNTIFITLLCFPSFLGASIFLSYTIWAVKPSEICGPFQTFETIYDSGKTWVVELEQSSPNLTWFTWIHQHLIQNSFFLFLISGILLKEKTRCFSFRNFILYMGSERALQQKISLYLEGESLFSAQEDSLEMENICGTC
ncbi:transmembrane channel-like protein 6 isoform X5 [Sceloporus undulatus]|uniref:transmembrane channel-like protein 6 isoform X5 n=1 Tax=Sceloporus undulatus TaxID=8520 RepID=UPI001C4BDF98|nr:transmembrane channel-like protein 6 isoform X5 [Sceloporus undulatus]